MADKNSLREELRKLRSKDGELKRIKALVGGDRHITASRFSSIEKKFVQPAVPQQHKYVPGVPSLKLVPKDGKESELSKLKGILKKEEDDLSKIKGLISSRRSSGPVPKAREVSIRQIEKLEKSKLAEVEHESKVVDQKLSFSLDAPSGSASADGGRQSVAQDPASADAVGQSVSAAGVASSDTGERGPGDGGKTNLNPAAIPLSQEKNLRAIQPALVQEQKPVLEGSSPQTEKVPQAKPAAPDLKAVVDSKTMPKEEAVDNRPLGEIIAEEEAKEKAQLAKEMEKEAAQDAKKAEASKKDEKPPGKFAGLLSKILPHHQEKPAAQPPAAGAQPQGGTPPQASAQPQAQQAVVQPQSGAQPQVILVPQIPSINATPGKVTVQEEVDLRKLTMDVEKLNAEFSALKETKTQSDERLQRIAEDVGELRSLFFQREEAFRDTQSTAEKLKSAVEELEPDRFLKALHKSESEIMLSQSKIEKLERLSEDSGKQLREMKLVLDNVKGIENLKELLKEINSKHSKVEELNASVERSTAKVEKLYVEIDRRLGEFNTFKAKLVTLDELTRELVKIVDEAKIKLSDTPNKSEFATLEQGIQEEFKQATQSLDVVKQQLASELANFQQKSSEIMSGLEAFKHDTSMQVTELQMQFDKEIGELRQQSLMIIDAVKEEVQRNTVNIDELRRMESYVELDRRIREHSLVSVSQPFKQDSGQQMQGAPQPFEEQKPAPRSISPAEIRDSLEDLKRRKGELTHLIDFLEDEYHRGIISERSYRESMENARNRLAEITRLIEIKDRVVKELPVSAASDDDRYVPLMIKQERDAQRDTAVSRIMDIQDRFEKINDMLSLLGGKKGQEGSSERKQAGPAGSSGKRQPGMEEKRQSGSDGFPAERRQSGRVGVPLSGGRGRVGDGSPHPVEERQNTVQLLSQVKQIRRSLDDKLDEARAHEQKIRVISKEKERLRKYHPHIHAKSKK